MKGARQTETATGAKTTLIYINGRRASRADLARLLQDLKNGKQTATAHTTKVGALAIVTTF